jgi:hypothetical protein
MSVVEGGERLLIISSPIIACGELDKTLLSEIETAVQCLETQRFASTSEISHSTIARKYGAWYCFLTQFFSTGYLEANLISLKIHVRNDTEKERSKFSMKQ